jgi:hypothetical protein
MDHWVSRKPTRDQREPILFNQVLKGRRKTHQYATRREFARANNLPIFAGKDTADFIAYPNAHDVSLQRCFFQNVGVGQTVERNVFSLYFCGTTAGAFLPGRQKFVIGSAPPVHRSVGLLFVPRRKFGGLLRRRRCQLVNAKI